LENNISQIGDSELENNISQIGDSELENTILQIRDSKLENNISQIRDSKLEDNVSNMQSLYKFKITQNPLEGFNDNVNNLQNQILDRWTKLADNYCFTRYDVPYVERTELYTAKSGNDIIKEMITFKIEHMPVCLKP